MLEDGPARVQEVLAELDEGARKVALCADALERPEHAAPGVVVERDDAGGGEAVDEVCRGLLCRSVASLRQSAERAEQELRLVRGDRHPAAVHLDDDRSHLVGEVQVLESLWCNAHRLTVIASGRSGYPRPGDSCSPGPSGT